MGRRRDEVGWSEVSPCHVYPLHMDTNTRLMFIVLVCDDDDDDAST